MGKNVFKVKQESILPSAVCCKLQHLHLCVHVWNNKLEDYDSCFIFGDLISVSHAGWLNVSDKSEIYWTFSIWLKTFIADKIKACTHSLAISSEKLSLPRHNSVNAYLWDQWSVDHLRLGQTVMITTGNKKLQHWFKYIIIKVCLDLIRGSVD